MMICTHAQMSSETPGVDTTAVGKVTSVEPPESRETSPGELLPSTPRLL